MPRKPCVEYAGACYHVMSRGDHEHGHLFQGRYKALIMNATEDGYVRRVSTYIHLNPVRAGLVVGKPGALRCYP